MCTILKARIHCEVFLSDYFMKRSLMHASLHLIWFHEIHVNYVKKNPSRAAASKINSKKSSVINLWLTEYIFSKNTTKKNMKRKRSVKVKPWLKNCLYTSAFNNMLAKLIMIFKNQCCFVSLFISRLIEQTGCLIERFFIFPYSN